MEVIFLANKKSGVNAVFRCFVAMNGLCAVHLAPTSPNITARSHLAKPQKVVAM